MKLVARLGVLALIAAPLGAIAALGSNNPQVEMATPGVGNGAIERFTARFNMPMVPLGDPRAASPFTIDCPVGGEGRWVDQQTFVHEFASALPGGVTCKFTLRDGLKSLSGYEVQGQRAFTVDSGGPIARSVLPSRYGSEIEEDQVFLVAANLAPDRASVAANAYCSVDGIGEKIPVDVLPADVAPKLVADLGTDRWEMQSFLSEAGLPQALPAKAEDRAQALASVVALKCRRPLPPGRDMALVWSKDIKSASGRAAGTDQRFDFSVRKPFAARFECSRVNPQAGCNPVQDAWVRFSAPIPKAQAEAVRIKLPDGKELTPVFSDDDKKKAAVADLKFKAPLPSATTAKLVLPADVADESGRKLSNAERFPLDVKFDAPPPLVKFAANFGILEAKEGGVLPVSVRNVEAQLDGSQMAVGGQSLRVEGGDGEVAKWLRAIDDAAETKSESVKRGAETVSINTTGAQPLLTPATGKPFKVNLPGGGKEFEVVGIPLTKPGFYVVELASPRLGEALLGRNSPRYVAAGALVTNMSVHFKWGRDTSLVWVTSLDTGQGVDKAEVRITDSCTGQLLARGTTDASGRLGVPAGLPEPETYGNCDNGDSPLMVSARKADDFSFTLTGWGEGIRPFDFDLPYGWQKQEQIFHTVFDRALVRQGETIHMKHIVRQPIASGFGTSPAFTGTLRLQHRGSDTQYDLPLSIDANGIGESEWTAPQGAKMGDYDLRVIVKEGNDEREIYTGQSFKVDEYKLPTMKASVAGPKDAAIRPSTLPLDLFVGYLSGGGAANLPVETRIGYFGDFPTPDGYDGYSFGGRAMAEGVKPMDGEGEDEQVQLPPTQTLPATLGADGTQRINAEVPQTLDQNTTMLVEMDYQDANGQILTSSKRIPIFTSGVQLGIKTDGWLMKQDDLRLRFVALDTSGKPLANQAISVELYSREILTARRRLIGGFYAYDNQMKTTKLGATCSATTDAQGLASCQLAPGVSGEVYAVATTKDGAGNVARATRSVWLVGDDDWWFGGDNGDRMDVIPERLEYKAGETAKFQVRMPFRDATALVTVEREGVLSSFVVGLTGKDPVIEVPMPGDYAPDVYVSVMAVRGRVTGWANWRSNMAREWGMPWSKDGGEPTALVDLAKPAYRLGMAKVKVGWEGHKLDVAVKADKERYAARDTANVDVEVKAPDGKPAASADLAFVAVDEALLQLAPNDSWNLLDAMMGDRPLSVLTSTAQTQVVGKRHYGKKAVEAGGGGGGGDLSGLNRENFQPVLLWKGRVALDANGRARVQVPLNDALTSFKLVAIATSGPQLFGTGMASIRSAQDLTIYPGVPQLVRTGDTFGAMFTLRNGSSKPMKVTATVALSPAVATGKPLTVEIPAGGAAPVVWNLTAPPRDGKLNWTVSAKSADGKAADKVTIVQSVIPAVPVETWAATLTRVGTGTTLPIAPPAGALPGFGAVEVSLTDTLAPPLSGVREYMSFYPYNCLEQRTSRAIALGDAGMWNLIASDIPAYQDNDGLLRYWPGDWPGSEALTAYVLSVSAEAGLPLPEGPRAKMLDAMKAVLDGRLRHEDYGDVRLQRVAAFTALARQGAATGAMLGQVGMTPAEMPTSSLADYAVALGKVQGLANGTQLRADAEKTLRTRLVYEGTRVDLSDKGNMPWWLMSSDDEAAIKALLATLGRPGWENDAAKMMVGIAARQQRGHWDNTTANAWGTILARRFMGLYPAQAIAGVTSASFGASRLSLSWPLAEPQRLFTLPLPAQQTPLVLGQSGGSGPWAFVRVKAAVPLTQPLMAGYRMTKKVEAVKQATPNAWTRGDVVKVTISVEASAERNWVVINDPVPAGATIVGNLGGQSEMLANQAGTSEGVSPSYVERGFDSWRAFYGWVPRGSFTVSYVMRLDAAGRFNLPATRVEAMYAPEIRAQVPNAVMTVAQR